MMLSHILHQTSRHTEFNNWQGPKEFSRTTAHNAKSTSVKSSILLSDAQNDTGSDWALKFLGQGTALL